MSAPQLDRAAFAPQVGSRFRAEAAGDREFELELLQLDDGQAAPGQEVFSLLFGAPPDAPVEQGIFHLEHPELGALDLFLVPMAADGRSVQFEAVINRLTGLPR